MPAGFRSRPRLVPIPDECTPDLGGLQSLIHGAAFRGRPIRDAFHRRRNDVRRSDVLERIYCGVIPDGPWKGCNWRRGMQATLQQHFEVAVPWFQIFKPHLEKEARAAGRMVGLPGLPEAEMAAFKWVQEFAELDADFRCTCVGPRRGFGSPPSWLSIGRRQHYAYLYMLCAPCRRKGRMNTVCDMQVQGKGFANALLRELPFPSGVFAPASRGPSYDERIDSMRVRCQNACIVGCDVEGAPGAKKRSNLAIVEPTWAGQVMAHRGGEIEASRIFVVTIDRHFINRCSKTDDPKRLLPDAYQALKTNLGRLHRVVESEHSSGGALPPTPPGTVFVEQSYDIHHAGIVQLVDLCGNSGKILSTSSLPPSGLHKHLPPGPFAALLSQNEAVRRAALQTQKDNMMTVFAVEEKLHEATDEGTQLGKSSS